MDVNSKYTPMNSDTESLGHPLASKPCSVTQDPPFETFGYLDGISGNANISMDYSDVVAIFNSSIDLAKSVYIPVAIFYTLYVLATVLMLPKFFSIRTTHENRWGQLIQFPIINHAFHIIRKYYTVAVALDLVLLALAGIFLFGKLGLASLLIMIPGGIIGIVAGVYSYIVGLFCQVYQVMIACEMFQGQKTTDEEDLKINDVVAMQMKKKQRLRNLYKIFLARDFLLGPALLIVDTIRVYYKMMDGEDVQNIDIIPIGQIFGVLNVISLSLVVPFATVSRLWKNRELTENRPVQNPLQKIMLVQGVVISVFTVSTLVIVTTLVLFGLTSLTAISCTFHSTAMILPLIVINAVRICCKRMELERSNEPVDLCKLEPGVAIACSEKPPIVETY